MTRFDHFLAYVEARRRTVLAMSALLIAFTALLDWRSPDVSVGYLYLVPVLLSAAALNRFQILAMAVLCGYLREVFEPLQGTPEVTGQRLWAAFNPSAWVAGSSARVVVAIAAYAMTGYFVSEMNRRRGLLAAHLSELEEQIRLRREAELQLKILVDTSPLAILTLDRSGRVLLANDSACQLLDFEKDTIQGEPMEPYLPILGRILRSQRSGGNVRTNVECKGRRRNGEVFLANVWLSTYQTQEGSGLAAVVWDASENLRDREGSGLDSMMATSRVLIGAVSHEIRNLAAAAASAYAALGGLEGIPANPQYEALGSLIGGLEKIASSGLRAASPRERAVADVEAVLDETRIVMEPGLAESGVSSIWEVAPGLPLVRADHHGLLQVFVNLARNSRQAMQASSARELRVSAALENDAVVVRFRDTGSGVAHPEELFRPFQQGAQSTGLGLYISHAILRSHGGALRHEATETGSCFAVDLWPAEEAE